MNILNQLSTLTYELSDIRGKLNEILENTHNTELYNEINDMILSDIENAQNNLDVIINDIENGIYPESNNDVGEDEDLDFLF